MSDIDVNTIAEKARQATNGTGWGRFIGALAARKLVEVAAPLIEQEIRAQIAGEIQRAAAKWEPGHISKQSAYQEAARIARGEA